MNFNKAEKLLKKIKNYRNINEDNYKNLKDLSKWLFLELNRQELTIKLGETMEMITKEQLEQKIKNTEKVLNDTFQEDMNKKTLKEIIDLEIQRSFLRGKVVAYLTVIDLLEGVRK